MTLRTSTPRPMPNLMPMAVLATAVLLAACASGPPRVEAFNPALPGSWSTMSVTSSGSFGSGTDQVRTTVGRMVWQGKEYTTQQTASGSMLLDPATGERMGFLSPGGQMLWTLVPAVGFRYPLEVGKSWTLDTTLTLMTPQGPRPVPMTSSWKVHAVEDVTVPAGTFKAMKIGVTDTANGRVWNDDVYWIDVAGQFSVKTVLTRPATNPQGAGTRESVLVANDIRR